jgi:hypothetical protein
VRAAIEGVVDFSKARLHDRRWWQRSWLLLGELLRKEAREEAKAELDLHLATLANARIASDPAMFKNASENATRAFERLQRMLQPWSEKQKTGEKELVDDLIQNYKQIFGDPTTAEFKAQEQRDLAADAERRGAVPVNPEQILQQRFRLREMQQQQKLNEMKRRRSRTTHAGPAANRHALAARHGLRSARPGD